MTNTDAPDFIVDGLNSTIAAAIAPKNAISPRVRTANFFELNPDEQTGLYENVWVFEKLIDTIASDMTREGWKAVFKGKNKPSAEATEELNRRLNAPYLKKRFRQAIKDYQIFGGSAIIADMHDGQLPETPLNLNSLKKIGKLRALDRTWVHPAPETVDYDLLDPEFYYVSPSGYNDTDYTNSYRVHESRVLRFDGLHRPHNSRIRHQGWGRSVIDVVYDPWQRLNQFETLTLVAVERLSVFIHSINGLTNFARKGQLDKLKQHLDLIHERLVVSNTLVMDGEIEQGKFESRSISGLDKLYSELKETLTAAVGMSWSMFWERVGTGGLSSTGNTESSNWAMKTHGFQKEKLEENLTRYANWIINSADFPYTSEFQDGLIEIKFNPLYPMPEKERVENDNKRADTLAKLLKEGLTLEQIQLFLDDHDLNTLAEIAPQPEPPSEPTETVSNEKREENSKQETEKVTDSQEPELTWFEQESIVTYEDLLDAVEQGKEVLPETYQRILEGGTDETQ